MPITIDKLLGIPLLHKHKDSDISDFTVLDLRYLYKAGIAGGQTAIGGTAVTDILKLQGTSGNGTLTSPALQGLVGNNGATVAYTVLNNGNVGIGTTIPAYKLDVSGGTGIVGQFSGRVIGGNAVNSNEFITLSQLTSGTGQYWSRTGSNLYPTTITDNVGIGTTAPEAKLDIPTNSSAINWPLLLQNNYNNVTPGWGVGIKFHSAEVPSTKPNKWAGIANRTSGGWGTMENLAFFVTADGDTYAPSEKMTLTGDGNVGIGTTAPSNILSLGGNVARVFASERHTTANTQGNTLTITAGGATSGATDKNGGNLLLQGGLSTGTGESGVSIYGCVAGASGTTDRTQTVGIQVLGNKIGFFAQTPVTRQTELTDELTTITHTAPGTPDYAIQDFTQTVPFGFVTADEANTVLSIIANLQARVNELETKLTAYGLLVDAD